MAFESLHERLVALQDTTTQLKDLIDRLANLNFQPGSVPLAAAEDETVASELSSEINQVLREQEEDLELLQEEITDIRQSKGSVHDKARLKDGAARLEQELNSCRVYFRKAQIQAKRNLQQAQHVEREILLQAYSKPRSGASSPMPNQPRRKAHPSHEITKEEKAVNASNDVTQALRRTHEMMASELSRSEFAHQTLKESTAALSSLSENYSSLNTLLNTSRDLLGTLLKSQKSDTWYLETAFYLLAGTISWLVFRRFFYGPLWWFVYKPISIVFSLLGFASRAVKLPETLPKHPESGLPAMQSGPASIGMNGDGVPTVNIQQQKSQEANSKDRKSLVDQVGELVDESNREFEAVDGDEKIALRERDEVNEPPNHKKRLWEEEVQHHEEQPRLRDEL